MYALATLRSPHSTKGYAGRLARIGAQHLNCVCADRRGVRCLRRKRRRARRAGPRSGPACDSRALVRGATDPPAFARNVCSRSPTTVPPYLHLQVMPRGRRTVAPSITIAWGSPLCSASSWRPCARSIPPTKTTSLSASPRWRMTNSFWWWLPPHQDPLVNEHLPACLVDAVGEAQVLLLAEACLVRVRAPHEATHDDAA